MPRPAYITRCPDCYDRIIIPDEWQKDKIKDEKGTRIIIWFDPDRMMHKIHSC